MASEIREKASAWASFTITLDALAAAAGRQATPVANSNLYQFARIKVKITSGDAAPVAGGTYDIYQIRSGSARRDDNAGAADAAITIENAPHIGALVVTATANKAFDRVFEGLIPGSALCVAAVNNTSQAIDNDVGDNDIEYQLYTPEAQ
jgi:hypothetical protein